MILGIGGSPLLVFTLSPLVKIPAAVNEAEEGPPALVVSPETGDKPWWKSS